MARIRTIKPEFWQHPKTASVDRDARLLFLGLLNEADDEGRMRYSAKRLAGVLFPFDDDVTPKLLDKWVTQLERVGLIERYEVENASYLGVCGFTEHQRINRPTVSALPVKPHGALTEDARGEVEREQGKEGEGNREVVVSPSAQPLAREPNGVATGAVETVFDAWKLSTHRNGSTNLSPKRRRLIAQALRDYSLADVLDAVRGWSKSPFHAGQNEQHKVYNDLELVLRDAQHVEQFRDLERGLRQPEAPSDPVMAQIQRQREMEGR